MLSGDIDNNDTTDINGVIIDTDYINGANANHVGKHGKRRQYYDTRWFLYNRGRANGGLSYDRRGEA